MTKWMEKLTKDFGILAADMPRLSNKVIKMPSPSLNWAVTNGGIVVGKGVTLFGPESGGKSLLMQLILAQIQRDDEKAICVVFDAEFSFNPEWFEKLGGDLNRLVIRQSNDPLEIFDYIIGEMHEMLQDGCPIKAIAIDSVRSIIYPKDLKEKTTNQTMGGSGAAYLGSALKRILPVIRKHNVTTILVQQVYEELDEYKKMRNPWVCPDGRALKHFSDYMLLVEKLETKAGVIEQGKTIAGGKHQVGHKVRVKTKKNRTGAPYRVAEFTLDYEKGIVDTGSEIFELAKSLEVIYHPINEATNKINMMMWKFGQYDAIRGQDNMKQWVIDNPDIQNEIMAQCDVVDDTILEKRNKGMEPITVNLEEL